MPERSGTVFYGVCFGLLLSFSILERFEAFAVQVAVALAAVPFARLDDAAHCHDLHVHALSLSPIAVVGAARLIAELPSTFGTDEAAGTFQSRWTAAAGAALVVWGVCWRLASRHAQSNDVYEKAIDAMKAKMHLLNDELHDRSSSAAREEQLQRAELARVDHFLAMTSHEMRTPLNGVIGNVHILADTKLTREQREITNTIRMSSETLLSIINDILDYSKLEAGKLTLEDLEYDVEAAVEEAAASLAPATAGKQLELVTFVDAAVPSVVVGDCLRLRQILLNLLSNAIKFTPAGHVCLRVKKVADAAGDNRGDAASATLRFEVEDTGIGLTPESIATVFRPFTQFASNRKYGGTGLGLSICKQLVTMMGGDIGMTSEPGRGTLCWFTVRVAVPIKASTGVARDTSQRRVSFALQPTDGIRLRRSTSGVPTDALRIDGYIPQRSTSLPDENLHGWRRTAPMTMMTSSSSSSHSSSGSLVLRLSGHHTDSPDSSGSDFKRELPNLEGLRVLLVDECPLVVKSVEEMLSTSAAVVVSRPSVADAVRELEVPGGPRFHALVVSNLALEAHLGRGGHDGFAEHILETHGTRAVVMRAPSLETTHFGMRPTSSRSSDNPAFPQITFLFKPLRRRIVYTTLAAILYDQSPPSRRRRSSVGEESRPLGLCEGHAKSEAPVPSRVQPELQRSPSAAASAPELPGLARSRGTKEVSETSGPKGRVLLAEDNVVNQKLMVRILEKMGWSVTIASDGRKCVNAFEADPDGFRLVFMDYHMPDMDGLEATRCIRAFERETGRTPIPIIALTASALPNDRDQCTAAGMDGFCSKPVVPMMIKKILEIHAPVC